MRAAHVAGRTPRALRPFRAALAMREGRAERIEAAAPLGPDDWESLRGLAGLRVLVLERGVAGDSEAEILASLPDLERLVLRQSPLSDAGFLALAGLPTLKSPHLIDVAIGDEGLAALAETRPQREQAHALLEAALSEAGCGKAVAIMELDELLRRLEGTAAKNTRDSLRYFVTIFGEPPRGGRPAAAGLEPDKGHYYRLAGPSFVVEFVNVQPDAEGNPANHIHCVWRDKTGDFR